MSDVDVEHAIVYKSGERAAELVRTGRGIEFRYLDAWIRGGGDPVASTLPVGADPVVSTGGAVPAFFAGLLPEGRRLSALRRAAKSSADDELSLLLAVGSDPVGDVQVVAEGEEPRRVAARVRGNSRNFSGVSFDDVMREYDIDPDRVALAGVQEKVSLTMLSVPVRSARGEFILKLTPPEYPGIIENEAYFIGAARRARVEAVSADVVTDARGQKGLAVERFDRVDTDGQIRSLAVEDGCQVLDLHPEAKYRATTEQVLRALSGVCAAPVVAASVFFRQLIFAYVSGNGDAHAKNFSVVSGPGGYRPAPAYDLPCTALYGDTSLALRIAGKRDGNVSRARFLSLASELGIREAAASRAIDDVAGSVDAWIDGIDDLPFDVGLIRKVKRIVRNRQRLLG